MLFISLPFSKKGTASAPSAPQPPKPPALPPAAVLARENEGLRRQLDEIGLQLEIYKVIIERYQKFIEDGEAKSIADLRGLVRPLDHSVVEMKINVQDAFHPYVYEKNFIQAVQKSLDMVFSFRAVSLPLNFWLQFEEMQHLNAADDIDRAILLCSLLRALGSESVRVLITKTKEAMVTFAFGNKQFVIEISKKAMSAYPLGDDQFVQIMHSVLYSFNDREYEDLSEG